MIADKVLKSMKSSILCWLATADEDGCPNVSPKEIFHAYDSNTLVIANIASPGSLRNIERQSRVCVSFVDVFVQKGYKLKGTATVHQQGSAEFDRLGAVLKNMAGERFPFATLFEVTVSSVEPIIAPSYRFYADTEEAKQVESAMRAYGVRPL